MTTELRTRLATPADAAAIAAIYNEGIADRVATFETEPRTPEQLSAQLVDKGDRFPTVVVERDSQVVAWASAGSGRSCRAFSPRMSRASACTSSAASVWSASITATASSTGNGATA